MPDWEERALEYIREFHELERTNQPVNLLIERLSEDDLIVIEYIVRIAASK